MLPWIARLVNEQIDAAGELVEQFDKFMPVIAAFWVKAADERSWSLYIAAQRVKQEGVARGNREIVRICQSINSPYLDLFQVKLVSADHPLARGVLDIHRRYPASFPFVMARPRSAGSASTERTYIHRLPLLPIRNLSPLALSHHEAITRSSCVEFILAGLYAMEKISRGQQHGRMVYEVGWMIDVGREIPWSTRSIPTKHSAS